MKEGRKESLRNLRYGYVRWRIRRQKDGKGTRPSPTIFPGFQTNCSGGSKMTLKGDLLWGCHARHRESEIFLLGYEAGISPTMNEVGESFTMRQKPNHSRYA